jgi:uncharacterized membrane protein
MSKTPASVGGHPLHSILVAFPVALWSFSLACDIAYRIGGGTGLWNEMAWYTMVAGVGSAVAAAVPGVIDFLSISDPRAGRIGLVHLAINVTLVFLFTANAWLRTVSLPGSSLPFALSVLGVAALLVSGWLGAEMVFVHKVGVPQSKNEPSTEAKRRRRAA